MCRYLLFQGKKEHLSTSTDRRRANKNDGDNEKYLGVPIGSRLLFRPATSLQGNLTKVIDSDLAPWQKLEVFCSYLVPSVSHHLATGRVEKSFLTELDRS